MQANRSGRSGEADKGPIVLAILMAGWSVWYLFDAWQASSRLQNLIFIAPAAALTVLLLGFILVPWLIGRREAPAPSANGRDAGSGTAAGARQLLKPLAVMGLLGLYVLALPVIGFDVATFLFVAASLVVQGERRPVFILLYSAIFAAVVVFAFKAMLTLDMPTLVI